MLMLESISSKPFKFANLLKLILTMRDSGTLPDISPRVRHEDIAGSWSGSSKSESVSVSSPVFGGFAFVVVSTGSGKSKLDCDFSEFIAYFSSSAIFLSSASTGVSSTKDSDRSD